MKVCRPFVSLRSAALARAALGVALGSSGLSCVERTDDVGATGSETHFLIECSESCAAGLDCIGGVCTSPCTSDESCAIWSAAAVCSADPAALQPGTCDVQCSVAADCAPLGAGYRCQAGSCRSASLQVPPEAPMGSAPPEFEVLEMRRAGAALAAAGSNCDPRDYMGTYFVDLPARQVSWANCSDEVTDGVYLSSTGQWPLADADRDDLLAAYRALRVGVSETCEQAPGWSFLDVTTADSLHFGYADETLGGCPITERGRLPIRDLSAFYQTLAPLISDRPRGFERESSTER